jgi:nucleoside-diphosphate-sugar epimerase
VRVLVTGGCGYKGSVLVPKLLAREHVVTVLDTCWFGNNVAAHPNANLLRMDLRELPAESSWLAPFDAIIHLAGIANDPCGELDAKLTWEVNVLATMNLAIAAAHAGVQQFIFASSASVYGIQDNKPVSEHSPMAPVSDYNKTKQVAERVLLSYANRIDIKILRPATVCGVSPRQRLDVVVNMLTMQALTKGVLTVHAGTYGKELMRPHIHIEDVTDLYCWLLERRGSCIFNAGFDNQTIGQTAGLISEVVPDVTLHVMPTADKRSYAVDSSSVLHAGFQPKRGVKDAVMDIVAAYREGRIADQERCYNLRYMQMKGLVSR